MTLVRMCSDSSALITQVRIFNLTRSLEQNRSCSVLLLMFQQRPNCLDLQMHLQLYTALEYGLFSGSTRTFVFIDIIASWANARSYCRLHYTDLASVRNMTENQEIDDLVPPGIRVWIGLFTESWKWMDGSNSSFTYWQTNEPNGPEPCVAANFLLNAKWEDWACGSQKEFVCNVEFFSNQT
uniref:C-type lectin domain-containing protein n=1 Tax=Maylandia zebra TaxID=106582 RepID=A0A3P9DNR1_9CICH